MRAQSIALMLGLSVLATSAGQAQSTRRLNPMIALHEKGLPVFGITHPAIVAGRARPAAPGAAPDANAAPTAAPPLPSLMDAARETVAYKFSDFAYNSYSSANADRFLGYMAAMLAAGGSMSSHAFLSKIPIVHADPAAATARIVEQLNAGHAGAQHRGVRCHRGGTPAVGPAAPVELLSRLRTSVLLLTRNS